MALNAAMDGVSFTHRHEPANGLMAEGNEMQTQWSWKQSPELMARLNSAQNHPANSNVDITTYAGFCDSEDDLARHVAHYEARMEAK